MSYKLGQEIVGAVLRTQRRRLHLRTKDIAQRAQIEAVNLISYIEHGTAAVTGTRVAAIARAYEFDEEEFALFWSVMRLIDEKIPPAVIRNIVDRATLWRGGSSSPDGSPGPNPRSPLRSVDRQAQSGEQSPLHVAAKRLLDHIGTISPDEEPTISAINGRVLIRSIGSTLERANRRNFRPFFCVIAALFLAAQRHEHYTWQLCVQT